MKARFASMLIAAFALISATLLQNSHAAEFTLSSPTLVINQPLHNDHVFNGFGCTGKNIPPKLVWHSSPAGTKSFAVTVFDPDAPTDSGWWHWLVINIPATASTLSVDTTNPSSYYQRIGATQIKNDFGQLDFGGACPPPGDKPHRYVFTVYALKTAKLELPPGASAALASYMIKANSVGKASITIYK